MLNTAELAAVFEPIEREGVFSGTVLVAQDGAVLFERAYGFASKQLNVPTTLDTKLHIASVSKMFIALAALILTEQGHIALNERPAAYLPELAALDPAITLHHLLSHTSGLKDIYDVPDLRLAMDQLKHEQGSLLAYLTQLPRLFPPGERWSYSSTGYILMGYLMERVTSLPFAELMRRYVLAPLSMHDSGLDDPHQINPGRAYGHTVENNRLVNAPNDELSAFPDAPGELYSTARDLKRWCDAMFDCPLVSPETLRLMFTPHAQVDWQVDPPFHYGYGWFLRPRLRMHGGGTPGFLSRIRQYPAQKASAILLCNADQVHVDPLFSTLDALILG